MIHSAWIAISDESLRLVSVCSTNSLGRLPRSHAVSDCRGVVRGSWFLSLARRCRVLNAGAAVWRALRGGYATTGRKASKQLELHIPRVLYQVHGCRVPGMSSVSLCVARRNGALY